MKRCIPLFVALGLATAGTTALAEQAKDPASHPVGTAQPVQMTDAQLDNVAAGALIVTGGLLDVVVNDVTVEVPVRILNNSVNNNTVQIPVAATVSAAVGVLGNAGSVATQTFGRQITN